MFSIAKTLLWWAEAPAIHSLDAVLPAGQHCTDRQPEMVDSLVLSVLLRSGGNHITLTLLMDFINVQLYFLRDAAPILQSTHGLH